MTLTFVTNLVHHHQLPLADKFYRLLGDDYHYISTMPLTDELKRGGYDPTLDRPYIIRTYLSQENMDRARQLIDNSDVVIHGDAPNEWVLKRKEEDKVTFHNSERWLKKLNIHAISPKTLYFIYKHYFRFRHKRTYMLCASAFTAQDVHKYLCFPNRCFKWAYFTAVPSKEDLSSIAHTVNDGPIKIMWCARFLDWKHPELPVQLAVRLKQKGYKFQINMYGSGEQQENTRNLIDKLGVTDCVNLCGNLPNAQILEEMRKHDLFLFTSDRNEGWGAVLNESMSNGCVPVASAAIGSVPYLIKDGENGLTFKSGSLDSLEKAVTDLLDNPTQRKEMAEKAQHTIANVWSPKVAAERFITLAQHALDNSLSRYNITEGPASWEK